MNVSVKKSGVFDVIEVQGRIDGLSAADLQLAIDRCTGTGARFLVVDCAAVSYVSSAGLRVFVHTYKVLNRIGGKMFLMSLSDTVREVFRISGMDSFMLFVSDLSVLDRSVITAESVSVTEEIDLDGFRFEMRTNITPKGRIRKLGSSEKLADAAFTAGDIITVPQQELLFGVGLAVLGNEFEDYKNLFGEAIVINHRFFSYPAVKRPFVDYSGYVAENPTSLNFLYGFGFSGGFSRVLKIPALAEPATVEELLSAAGKISGENLFGVVILAVSGGICGLHLRKSPIGENNPEQNRILRDIHFAEWMNFSVEGEDIHKITIAAGIVVRDPLLLPDYLSHLFPVNSGMHLHAVVFENGLLSLNISEFEKEQDRVMKEFEPQKVIHLLPSSRLQSGFIGIINLEAN